jgi:hypothetical protein
MACALWLAASAGLAGCASQPALPPVVVTLPREPALPADAGAADLMRPKHTPRQAPRGDEPKTYQVVTEVALGNRRPSGSM